MDVNKDVYLTMATRQERLDGGCTIFPLPSSRSDGEPSDDVTGSCCSLSSFAK